VSARNELQIEEDSMKLKTLAAAAALMTAASAYAVGPGNLGNIDNQIVAIGDTNQGVFLDVYTFEVSGSGGVLGALLTGTADVQINGIGFLDAANNVLATDLDGSDGFAALITLTSGGIYHFAVNGTALGGSYEGILQTQIAPAIPEPETYALMLAGLGAIGWAARRRQRA
jgi:hypothetical protein